MFCLWFFVYKLTVAIKEKKLLSEIKMNEEEINDIVYEANRNIIQLKKLLELTQKFRGI